MIAISIDKIPLCPSCGSAMKFARSFPNFGAREALQTFECKKCSVALTTEEVLERFELAGSVVHP
jgi:hypothetical protein